MKKIILMILMGWLVVCNTTVANTEQENTYLTQILNALNAIQPLIIAAEKQQPPNTRMGGETMLVSSIAVHNEILKTRPELLDVVSAILS